MKQFTNKDQTQHLIKLGFPRPCSISDFEEIVDHQGTTFIHDHNYSIGELLSFLEEYVDDPSEELLVWKDTIFWYVRLSSDSIGAGYDEKLINALYKYIVELKEEE